MPSPNNTHAITAGRAAEKGENFNSQTLDESFTVVLMTTIMMMMMMMLLAMAMTMAMALDKLFQSSNCPSGFRVRVRVERRHVMEKGAPNFCPIQQNCEHNIFFCRWTGFTASTSISLTKCTIKADRWRY